MARGTTRGSAPTAAAKQRRTRGILKRNDDDAAHAAPSPVEGTAEEQAIVKYLRGKPAETAIEAIIDDHSAWQTSADGQLFYGERTGTYIAIGDPRAGLTAEQQILAVDKILALDDNTAQTFMYVMTRDLASDGSSEKIRIHVNEILDFKGLKRHKHGDHRPELKKAEQSRLVLLSDMWVAVNDEIKVPSGKGYRNKRIKLISRLVDLAIETEDSDPVLAPNPPGMLPLPLNLASNTVPYAFRLGLGEWARAYRSDSSYVREVLAKIVEYDASKESQRYAMRIALCLMFSNNERRVSWKLADLISKAHIDLPTHHADRFRETVESALDRLERDALIGTWQYANDNDGQLPGKRWLQRWLQWDIVFIPRRKPAALSG